MNKCCKHLYKDNHTLCFPESSFGVISTKLYRANVGKLTSTLRTFTLYLYEIFVSSDSSKSGLGPSHSGAQQGLLSRGVGPADGAP